MKKLFALIILVSSISWTSQAQQEDFQSPKLIGEGTLKVLMWEVYDLRLLTDGTSFSWNNKFMLEFDYSRELKKESVIDASLKEFKLQPNVTDKDIKAWEEYLEQVIQPVQKGTKASVMWVPEGQIVFNYEDSLPSTIENEDFARAFLNICLLYTSPSPRDS